MGIDKDIRLSGNFKQQAEQLFDLIKDRQLTPEQLDKILPTAKEFFQNFNDVLKSEIAAGKECNINTVKVLQASLEKLIEQLGTQATKEEKEQILKVILEIQNSIKEIELNRQNKSNWFKSLLAILGALVMIIIVILTAGKVNPNNKS